MPKGSAQLFLIVTTIIILIGGVYFYNNSHNNSLQNPKSLISKQSDSKDYSNQSLGFSLKYSKDLKAQEDSEEDFNKRGNGNFRKNFKGYVGYEPGKFISAVIVLDKNNSFDKNPFTVWVFDNTDNLSIEKWYENYWYYPFVWGDFTYNGKFKTSPQNIATISGQLAKLGTIDYQPGKPKFVYLSKDNKMYLFRIIGDSGEKILSTFKFVK